MILSFLPQNLVVLSLHQNRVDLYLYTCFRTSWFSPFTSQPRGPPPFPSEPCGSPFSLQNRMVVSSLHQSCLILALFLSPQNLVVLSSFTSEPHGPLSIYLLQNLVVLPFTSEPHGLLLSMAAGPRFKSQHPSSFAAPFPTPPTVGYTCQHPRILPALLSCHSKSGQVWPLSLIHI